MENVRQIIIFRLQLYMEFNVLFQFAVNLIYINSILQNLCYLNMDHVNEQHNRFERGVSHLFKNKIKLGLHTNKISGELEKSIQKVCRNIGSRLSTCLGEIEGILISIYLPFRPFLLLYRKISQQFSFVYLQQHHQIINISQKKKTHDTWDMLPFTLLCIVKLVYNK